MTIFHIRLQHTLVNFGRNEDRGGALLCDNMIMQLMDDCLSSFEEYYFEMGNNL